MSAEPVMASPPHVYHKRRAEFAKQLRRPILIFSGHGQARNYPANPFPFRANGNYLYLGGPPLENAAWFIEPLSDGQSGCTLIRTPSTLDDRVWMGEMASDEALCVAAGLNTSRLASPEATAKLLCGRTTAAIIPPCPATIAWAQSLPNVEEATPDELLPLIEMRLCKDDHELEAMRRAAQIACRAHIAAMRMCAPGQTESDVAAAYGAMLEANRCAHSFNPIITIKGEVLHSHGHPHSLEEGRLLLVDAGAEELTGYATDMTRTYPVNGQFTEVQRAMYDIVLRAEEKAIAACKVGVRYRDIHDLSAKIIIEGLVDLGYLKGNVNTLLERRAHVLFFVHGVGHLIGIDVHDMEDFGDLAGYASGRTRRDHFGDNFLRLDRDLEEGMTVTIEPGIYFVPAIWENNELSGKFNDVVNRKKVEALLEANFGGIRIEDTINPRKDESPEIFTAAAPKEPEAMLKIVAN